MVIRRRWVALPLACALGCATMPTGLPPEHDDDERVEALVVTSEIDPAKLEALTIDLEVLVEGERRAMAVAYDPEPGNERLELLPECTVPVRYQWISGADHEQVFDSAQDMFVTDHPGRADTWVRLQRGAHAELQIERVAEIRELVPDAPPIPACEGATHVISGFALGVRTPGELETLVALTISPLGDPVPESQQREETRDMVLDGVLIVLGGLSLAGAAALCIWALSEGDHCIDNSSSDDAYADAEDPSERAAPARLPAPNFPTRGVEIRRTKRVSVEAGAGGFTLRF